MQSEKETTIRKRKLIYTISALLTAALLGYGIFLYLMPSPPQENIYIEVMIFLHILGGPLAGLFYARDPVSALVPLLLCSAILFCWIKCLQKDRWPAWICTLLAALWSIIGAFIMLILALAAF